MELEQPPIWKLIYVAAYSKQTPVNHTLSSTNKLPCVKKNGNHTTFSTALDSKVKRNARAKIRQTRFWMQGGWVPRLLLLVVLQDSVFLTREADITSFKQECWKIVKKCKPYLNQGFTQGKIVGASED